MFILKVEDVRARHGDAGKKLGVGKVCKRRSVGRTIGYKGLSTHFSDNQCSLPSLPKQVNTTSCIPRKKRKKGITNRRIKDHITQIERVSIGMNLPECTETIGKLGP